MTLRRRTYLRERKFVTMGKKGRHDPLGIILGYFFHAVPEFVRSLQDVTKRKNGFTLSGAWPTSGRHVFDWEMEAWGERGGDVIIKTNLWAKQGWHDGISYRTSLPQAHRVAYKFAKWVWSQKPELKRKAAA